MKFVPVLLWLLIVAGLVAIGVTTPQDDSKKQAAEIRKIRALADNLILTARGLTSRQKQEEIEFADEYSPLAEWVINNLTK